MSWLKNNWLGLFIMLLMGIVVGWGFHSYSTIYADPALRPNERGDAFNGLVGPVVALFAAFLVYLSFQQQIRANELQKSSIKDTLDQTLQIKNYEVMLLDLEALENKIANINVTYKTKDGPETYQGAHGINEVMNICITYWENRKQDPYGGHISESQIAEVVALFRRVKAFYEGLKNKKVDATHRTELYQKVDILMLEKLSAMFEGHNPLLTLTTHLEEYHKDDHKKEISQALMDEYAQVHTLYIERVKFKGTIEL